MDHVSMNSLLLSSHIQFEKLPIKGTARRKNSLDLRVALHVNARVIQRVHMRFIFPDGETSRYIQPAVHTILKRSPRTFYDIHIKKY